jgi:hypothetical protein
MFHWLENDWLVKEQIYCGSGVKPAFFDKILVFLNPYSVPPWSAAVRPLLELFTKVERLGSLNFIAKKVGVRFYLKILKISQNAQKTPLICRRPNFGCNDFNKIMTTSQLLGFVVLHYLSQL